MIRAIARDLTGPCWCDGPWADYPPAERPMLLSREHPYGSLGCAVAPRWLVWIRVSLDVVTHAAALLLTIGAAVALVLLMAAAVRP